MTRWLAILILLASCQGCMIFDDLGFYDGPGEMPPPQGTCNMATPLVQQTPEPPLRCTPPSPRISARRSWGSSQVQPPETLRLSWGLPHHSTSIFPVIIPR